MQSFLSAAEQPIQPEAPAARAEEAAATLRGTVTYGPGLDPVLTAVDFSAKRGDLVMVVGATGSGKSSFLAALLGLTEQGSSGAGGGAEVRGKVAFVSQQAYIFGGSLWLFVAVRTPATSDLTTLAAGSHSGERMCRVKLRRQSACNDALFAAPYVALAATTYGL